MRVKVIGGAGSVFFSHGASLHIHGEKVFSKGYRFKPGGYAYHRYEFLKKFSEGSNPIDVSAHIYTGSDAPPFDLVGDVKVEKLPGESPLYLVTLSELGTVREEISQGTLVNLTSYTGTLDCDAVLLTMDLPVPFVKNVLTRAKEKGIKTFLRYAPFTEEGRDLLPLVDYLIVGRTEAWLLSGQSSFHHITAQEAAKWLREMGAENVVIDLGKFGAVSSTEKGNFGFTGYKVNRVIEFAREAVFDAALVYYVLNGYEGEELLRRAVAASSLYVSNAFEGVWQDDIEAFVERRRRMPYVSLGYLPLKEILRLKEKSAELALLVMKMLIEAKSGHPGGSLSLTDLLSVLFYKVMRYRSDEPLWEGRDRFILSKGHGVPALYAVFLDMGILDPEEIHTLRKLGSRLQGHPDRKRLPALEMTTGSLGQGLSVANGLAIGGKLRGADWHVYVVLGDGEMQEGQVWEAIAHAASRKLDNITVIVDYNGLQIDGPVGEIKAALEPLTDKVMAFGWESVEIYGHDPEEIYWALKYRKKFKDKPFLIVAHTVKGHGVSFMEGNVEWHGKAPSGELAEQALRELEERLKWLRELRAQLG